LSRSPTVLIVDDDPSHLKLYSWVLERGGFHPVTALVRGETVDIPEQPRVDVAVLDYRLGPLLRAADLAQRLRSDSPSMPIVVLSDMPWMPEDVAPYASGFVRKGEPQQLLDMIGSVIGSSPKDDEPGAQIA
jgi:two-component system, NtrC family, response regulator GlrR